MSSKREYLPRMLNDKVQCMGVAKRYDEHYWDGDRRYGYGGYRYLSGRWRNVAEQLIKTYHLIAGSRVLDVGCGKGYLLHEMLLLEPGLDIVGTDISAYAISNATDIIKPHLLQFRAQDQYPFEDGYFDLVISLGVLHNLNVIEIKKALVEIDRVSKNGYIMVESYRTDQELFNLQCWALTCESFFNPVEWVWLFGEYGYSGDFEFIYFE